MNLIFCSYNLMNETWSRSVYPRATPSVIGNKLKNANKWEFETFLKYSLYETGL